MEDATLALRAAFVLTVTFSDDASDGDVDASVCDSIVYIDLKSRISVLLSIAKDGRKSVRSSRSVREGRGGQASPETNIRLLR